MKLEVTKRCVASDPKVKKRYPQVANIAPWEIKLSPNVASITLFLPCTICRI